VSVSVLQSGGDLFYDVVRVFAYFVTGWGILRVSVLLGRQLQDSTFYWKIFIIFVLNAAQIEYVHNLWYHVPAWPDSVK
jgi:hypothetical protein